MNCSRSCLSFPAAWGTLTSLNARITFVSIIRKEKRKMLFFKNKFHPVGRESPLENGGDA